MEVFTMKRFLSLLACSAMLYWMSGCAKPPAPAPVATQTPQAASDAKDPSQDHHTHGAGPHGGTLADWGGGSYHVEFTVDHDKKEATVYIVGSDAKSPAPIKTDKVLLSINDPSFQLELKAQPREGEVEGKSSRFVGQHENLGKVQEFAGTISAEVEGTPYAGDFQEEPHGADNNK
jgi:hypothetical protein